MQTAFSFRQSALILAMLVVVAGLTACDTTSDDGEDRILNLDLNDENQGSASGSFGSDDDSDSGSN